MKTYSFVLLLFFVLLGTMGAQRASSKQQNPQLPIPILTPINSMATDTILPLEVDKDFLLGKIDYPQDIRFVQVDSIYTNKETFVLKEVYEAFLQMHEAALKDGVNLLIVSGARNFSYQKGIWERKWANLRHLERQERAAEILKFSAMPTSSRHHWGTDIDLNNLENDYFEKGEGLKIYIWLQKNGPKFGFCQVYTDKAENNRPGFEMEKWHWSYFPLSQGFLTQYNQEVSYEDIKEFSGSDLAPTFKIIENYVNGIADCGKEKH